MSQIIMHLTFSGFVMFFLIHFILHESESVSDLKSVSCKIKVYKIIH